MREKLSTAVAENASFAAIYPDLENKGGIKVALEKMLQVPASFECKQKSTAAFLNLHCCTQGPFTITISNTIPLQPATYSMYHFEVQYINMTYIVKFSPKSICLTK